MPAVGRKPKPEDQRRNRAQPAYEWVEVMDAPFAGAVPELGDLPPRTMQWWAAVAKMPHCVLWDDADWQFAIDTAYVHSQWVSEMTASFASELRQREKLLGLTWDARRDLRIRYISAGLESTAERPISLEERRRMLAE
jgi:hypothetical protein